MNCAPAILYVALNGIGGFVEDLSTVKTGGLQCFILESTTQMQRFKVTDMSQPSITTLYFNGCAIKISVDVNLCLGLTSVINVEVSTHSPP